MQNRLFTGTGLQCKETLQKGNTHMKDVKKYSRELLRFIEKSPSPYHGVRNISDMLTEAGAEQLNEAEGWKLEAGKTYFAVRNDSALIAFTMPQGCPKGFHIVASHCDSPTFKLKEQPEISVEGQYVKLNVEGYGGMIMSSWLDRSLSIAGRIVVENKKSGEPLSIPVCVDRDLLVIPNVAIHMNREINQGVKWNPQIDLQPLFSGQVPGKGENPVSGLLAETAGVKESQIIGQDLFLYVREKGRFLGANEEFILSPRLDDLQCAFCGIKAFLEAKPKDFINVYGVFDHEEVGSGSMQGADSTFLSDVLERVVLGMGESREKFLRLLADSFLLSADNAHAVHPNHPEKSDPTNRPFLNGGVVLKFHGEQKYTTDSVSAAKVKLLCKKAGVPCQTFANRADTTGGSTLGRISASHVSIHSADIGLPQLAMHSAVETAGVKDTAYAVAMLKAFYEE